MSACSYCERGFEVGDKLLFISPGVGILEGEAALEDEEPAVVHESCMVRGVMKMSGVAEDELYERVLARIQEEGACPHCSPFVPDWTRG